MENEPKAGQIWRSVKSKRYVRIQQVRSGGVHGLDHALVEGCGPKGRAVSSKYLSGVNEKGEPFSYPVHVQLGPGGTMPAGYVLAGAA